MKATTDVNGSPPTIRDVTCFGSNGDVEFSVDWRKQLNSLRLSFHDERGHDITLIGDGLMLHIDSESFEYRNIPQPSRQFRNVTYPLNKSDVILPVWHGYRAVRRNSSEPFVNISQIYGKIVDARQVTWSFASRNWAQVNRNEPENALPADWRSHRYLVNTRGLKEAVAWCARAVESDQASVLPTTNSKGRP